MSTRDDILYYIKLRGPASADQLAEQLGVTAVAIRQHLAALASQGMVDRHEAPASGARGRPLHLWHLLPAADTQFPDSHADLTLDLLSAIRESMGDTGMESVLAARMQRQLRAYSSAMSGGGSVKLRVERLAELRSREGYIATWFKDGSDYYLAENHCPICSAASHCRGICDAELELFQALFQGQATVTREEHITQGARRCLYRICPVAAAFKTRLRATKP